MNIDSNPPTPTDIHGAVWYDDGTALIVVRYDTTYKVYAGILRKHSPRLNALLGPEPKGEYLGRRLPVIECPDDYVKDWMHFLKAMHDSSYYMPDTLTDFNVVVGVLRLSTKYQVAYLRKRSIEVLTRLYPPTFSELIAVKWSHSQNIFAHGSGIKAFPAMRYLALELAHECNVPIVLPTLLFCCSLGKMEEVVYGIEHEGRNYSLSEDNKRRIIDGQQGICAARQRLYQFLYDAPAPHECATRCGNNSCDRTRLATLRSLYSCPTGRGCNPFLDSQVFPWEEFQAGVCEPCFQHSRRICVAGQNATWDDLPSIYGLGSWDTLKDQMRDDFDN